MIEAKEYDRFQELINKSIELIKKYAPMADKYGGYTVAFSGGKDSQVLLELFKMSGVRYHAVYNVTTNDPPENVYFIKQKYPEVEFSIPKMSYLKLIESKKILPMMNKRYCCAYLKEKTGKGLVATGVRREESTKRSKYETIEFRSRTNRKFYENKMRRNRTVLIRPILEWTEKDVWHFIEEHNLPINPCYEHYGRVGCLFCPYASTRRLHYVADIYPRYYALFLRTIQRLLDKGYLSEFNPLTPEKVFDWWASKVSAKLYFRKTHC